MEKSNNFIQELVISLMTKDKLVCITNLSLVAKEIVAQNILGGNDECKIAMPSMWKV